MWGSLCQSEDDHWSQDFVSSMYLFPNSWCGTTQIRPFAHETMREGCKSYKGLCWSNGCQVIEACYLFLNFGFCVGCDIFLWANCWTQIWPSLTNHFHPCVSKGCSGPGNVSFLCNQPCPPCIGIIAKVWVTNGGLVSPLSKVTDLAHSRVIVSVLNLLSISVDLFDEGDGGKGIHGHYQWISLCVVPSCKRTTSSSIDRFGGICMSWIPYD